MKLFFLSPVLSEGFRLWPVIKRQRGTVTTEEETLEAVPETVLPHVCSCSSQSKDYIGLSSVGGLTEI